MHKVYAEPSQDKVLQSLQRYSVCKTLPASSNPRHGKQDILVREWITEEAPEPLDALHN